jgi:DNA repair exonuclease SbcCD nuclease subunit
VLAGRPELARNYMRKEVRMASQQLRFLHSSDWQLEQPLGGVLEIPADLREPFLDAPYQAAERVVQAALEYHVDFLILSGNILSFDQASPYSFEFLLGQLQRLAEQHVAVYWLGSSADDPELWPAQLALPDNVKWFPTAAGQILEHQRDGRPVARLIGQSQRKGLSAGLGDLGGGDDSLPRIAVGFGTVAKRALENKSIDYWALGGQDRHRVLMHGKGTAAYSGSPQGRTPADTDAHGAVLVELQLGQAKTRLIETDLFRWRHEKVLATELESVEGLQAQIARQLAQVPAESARHTWLLSWTVIAQGKLAEALFVPDACERLARTINQLHAHQSRWSLAIDVEPVAPPAEQLEEDTILGDFLRSVQRFQQTPDAWRELVAYLPESEVRETLITCLQDGSDENRQELWGRVAAWGADLLRGEATVDAVAAGK